MNFTMQAIKLGSACIAAITLLCAPALAEERYKIDRDHTFVHFAVVHSGVSSLRGRIGVSEGSASFDLDRRSVLVSVTIDLDTLDTGVKKLDAALVGEQFFNIAKFRTARFTGRAIQFEEGVPSEFDGELTIMGVSRPVQLTAQRFVCKEVKILIIKHFVCGGDLSATVKRSDFGLDKYLDMVSDEVRLDISVEAIRQQAP